MRFRSGACRDPRREGDPRPARAGAPRHRLRRSLSVLADRRRVHAVGRTSDCGRASIAGILSLDAPVRAGSLLGGTSRFPPGPLPLVRFADGRLAPSRILSERLRLWLERTREGYRLRDAATEELVRHEDPRIRVIKVAGVSYRLDELQDDAFAPGRRLALVPEPDNEHDPNAISVWDEQLRVQGGYVPAETARELDAGAWQAVSLVEFLEDGRRVGLRVLLAPRDAWIGMP
ncbi:MAG: hypothetical protein E6G33_01525, partial [Actinobacteria bacterium]